MLKGTLLDDKQRAQLKQVTATHGAMSRPGAALERATAGLGRYAALRAARAKGGAPADTDVRDHRAAFDDACAAVAEAAGQVKDIPGEVVAAISGLLAQGSAGAAAVRSYWVDLGFPPAEVDAYLAEGAAGRTGLPDVARLVQTVADWRAPLVHFGAGHPDYANWGFGFAGEGGALDDHARAFVAASREAGVTPSLYLVTTILLLLDKLVEELGTT